MNSRLPNPTDKKYGQNHDRIFRKKDEPDQEPRFKLPDFQGMVPKAVGDQTPSDPFKCSACGSAAVEGPNGAIVCTACGKPTGWLADIVNCRIEYPELYDAINFMPDWAKDKDRSEIFHAEPQAVGTMIGWSRTAELPSQDWIRGGNSFLGSAYPELVALLKEHNSGMLMLDDADDDVFTIFADSCFIIKGR